MPERLAAAAGDPLRLQTEIENLTRQLERNNALQRDAADWAVLCELAGIELAIA